MSEHPKAVRSRQGSVDPEDGRADPAWSGPECVILQQPHDWPIRGETWYDREDGEAVEILAEPFADIRNGHSVSVAWSDGVSGHACLADLTRHPPETILRVAVKDVEAFREAITYVAENETGGCTAERGLRAAAPRIVDDEDDG